MDRKSLGRIGEERAAKYLQQRGYEILARNFRCRCGEIDIIARDGSDGSLVFAEVKTRKGKGFGLPCEAVTAEKRRHLRYAAETYIAYAKCADQACRMDVIEIYAVKKHFYIRHLQDCF